MSDSKLGKIAALSLVVMFLVGVIGTSIWAIFQMQDPTDSPTEDIATPSDDQEDLKMKEFTPLTEPIAEVYHEEIVTGEGEVVQDGDQVTVLYVGFFASTGEIFDENISRADSGFTFGVGAHASVIEGWQTGLLGMAVGGQRRLFVPWDKAYGEEGRLPTIPPKSDLVFDIELLGLESTLGGPATNAR